MNRKNLEKLAAYLEKLPTNYRHFSMWDFSRVDGVETSDYSDLIKYPSECGAVACAVGHGPAAGIPARHGEDWNEYSDRMFDLFEDDWQWCFSPLWLTVDDTPQGAAKRIRYLLEHGVPEDFVEQIDGDAAYLFSVKV